MRKILLSALILAALGLLTGCAGTLTPLMTASKSGNIIEVRALIANGADVNEENDDRLNALHHAAIGGNAAVVQFLIEKGVDINAKDEANRTSLHYAANRRHVDVVRLLIEAGADVNAQDKNGFTALMHSVRRNNVEIVKLLLDAGADIWLLDGAHLWTALRWAEHYKLFAIIPLLKKAEVKPAVKELETNRPAQEKRPMPALRAPNIPLEEKLIGENDYAIVIGIENYQSFPKSEYSKSDAMLVKDYLKALGFQERNIELITDERATRSGIEKAMEGWLPNNIKNGSRVFIYYSGHGTPEPLTGEPYIFPYDGDPNYLAQTGYPLKRLYDNLGKLQAAEVTVILDACFSGAGGRSVLAKGARPLVMVATGTSLPSNIAVLSSTQGSQISSSSPEKGHGIFTYYFLKAIKDGKKDLSEIYEYIKPLVEDEAKGRNVNQSPSLNPEPGKVKGRFSLRK